MALPDVRREALSNAGWRFAQAVREAGAPQQRMPRSGWSPVEAAVHVLQLLRIFAGLAGGGNSPYTRHEEFSRISDELIAAEPERDPATLAGLIEEATATWIAAASGRLPTDPFDWHGIVTITFADAMGILLGEFLVHGRDIAAAGNRPWEIAPEDARTILTSVLPLLPIAVDGAKAAGVHTRYGVHIRGLPPLSFTFVDSQLTIARWTGRWTATWPGTPSPYFSSPTVDGRTGRRSSGAGCSPGGAGPGGRWPSPRCSATPDGGDEPSAPEIQLELEGALAGDGGDDGSGRGGDPVVGQDDGG